MATVFSRLALFGTFALLGSGCTLHVVSGPVSHQRTDHDHHYAMTPDRVQVLRPAPRRLPREQRAESRHAGDRQKRPQRDAAPVRTETAERDRSTSRDPRADERRSLRDRQRLADVRQRSKDSKRPDSRRTKSQDAEDDDSRNVRFPYWVSRNEERIDLDGSQVRSERRAGER